MLRFRTFSKAYGMAGARIAYAIGEASVVKSFDKIRNHFGVNAIALAGALASLADPGHLASVVAKVKAARERIGAIARANGLAPLRLGHELRRRSTAAPTGPSRAACSRELVARDVFVRMPGVAPLDRCIRVTAGTDADLAVLAAALPEALSAARAAG